MQVKCQHHNNTTVVSGSKVLVWEFNKLPITKSISSVILKPNFILRPKIVYVNKNELQHSELFSVLK